MDYQNFIKFNNKNNINILNDYFFIKNGTLVNPYDILDDNTNNFINLECHRKIKGGNPIIKIVSMMFKPILDPIEAIGNVVMFLIKALFWTIMFIIWFIRFLLWVFVDLLNPVTFFGDFFKSLTLIVYALITTAFTIVLALFKLGINTVAGWMQGFWGWDMSNLTKNDKNSPYFKSFDRTKGQKVYYTNKNTVPFSIILGTILCPPMGVFMDLGTSGWINIIICALLTLLFYIPGLCYALLIIYS
jgi:uncharacterized membrane protein YqaE (UPF0057 family)